MPFFIKAASLALSRYPTLNSSINAELTEITIKVLPFPPFLKFSTTDYSLTILFVQNYHNIGVAMDTPQGLVVPNIKDVQDKSVLEIAKVIWEE